MRRAVYEHPPSPYRALLEWAGCQYGDLERLVAREGVEGALSACSGHGVYLSVDELKGRQPVVRGADVLAVEPGQLPQSRAPLHVSAWSSGSRGAGTPILDGLDSIRDRAVDTLPDPRRARRPRLGKGRLGEFPGSLTLMLIGTPPSARRRRAGSPAWTRTPPAAIRATAGAQRALRWARPSPAFGSRSRTTRRLTTRRPSCDGCAPALRPGTRPSPFWAFPSAAVRVCQAAAAAGVDIRGRGCTVTGEPVTAARLAAIRAAGVDAVPDYGSAESGGVAAYGCLSPEAPDDVHVSRDLHAVVQPGAGPSRPAARRAVCLSSLRLTSPLVLLNVSMGDQAILGARACGCPSSGWAGGRTFTPSGASRSSRPGA